MKTPKMPKPGALVRLTWVDSARHLGGNDGWVQREDLEHGVMQMESVGWVWNISEDAVTLAPHTDEHHNQAYGVLTIPWCAVVAADVLSTHK